MGPIHFNTFQNFSYPDNFKIEDPLLNMTKSKLPTIMRRENIAFDNGTVIIFQTIMIDTKNKTTQDLNNQYKKFHEYNIKSLKKNLKNF
jgi:hypothetical protein